MAKKIVLITLLITVVSYGLSVSLAKHYGDENMVQYLQDVANHTFNHKSYKGTLTEEAISAEKINELEISGTGVDIKVEKSSNDKVKLLYSKTPQDQISELIHINGLVMKLNLDNLENHGSYVQFNFTKGKNYYGALIKEPSVVIQVPENIKRVVIKTVSGDLDVVDLSLDDLKIKSVSGDVHVTLENLKNFEQESVSGDIELFGNTKDIKAKTISGNMFVDSKIDNPNLKFVSTSGDLKVAFEKEPNFSLKFETVSGEMIYPSKFTQGMIDSSVKNFTFGKGEGLFDVQTTSGNIKIVPILE
ncbi:DUF4097 domain-containing protein [bacterium]|nr:DUF4097 domain-containing protein [bacterium]